MEHIVWDIDVDEKLRSHPVQEILETLRHHYISVEDFHRRLTVDFKFWQRFGHGWVRDGVRDGVRSLGVLLRLGFHRLA